jgi:glycosyltransferase involved in cell wall biosynthesis
LAKWLIISYFANIDAMAPSHHIDDKLPYLKQRGIEVNFLSSPCGARHKGIAHTRVFSPAPSGIRFETRHLLKRSIKSRLWYRIISALILLPLLPFYFLEKLFQKATLKLDSTWSWFIFASAAGLAAALRKKPSVIYSTGGSVSAHLTALLTAHLTNIPWIAEFQDPLVYQYPAVTKTEGRFIRWVERAICRKADKVIFLTNEARLHAAKRIGHDSNLATIYPGADAGQFQGKETENPTGSCVFAHFGSLGGTRNLEYFIKGLESVFDEFPEFVDLFRLELYGNTKGKEEKHIDNSEFKNVVKLFGKVRRQDAINAMLRCNVLLLIQNTDGVSSETIPSKVYEYLHTGKPILALVYRNPELQAMLEGMGHIVVQADDVHAIKKGIMTYFLQWRENRLAHLTKECPYTVERAVDELLALAGNIRN